MLGILFLFVLVFVFASVFLLIVGAGRTVEARRNDYSRRFQEITKGSQKQEGLLEKESGIKGAGAARVLLRTASGVFKPSKPAKWLDRQLARADIPLRGEEFLVLIAGGVLAGGFVAWITTGRMVFILLVCGFCLVLPMIWIKTAWSKRVAHFNSQIGDALVVMSSCLRSGFSFLQAMDMVRKEMSDPIAREFSRVFREVNLGTTTEDALHNLAKRIESDDLELVVTAVLINRQVGGNLADVFDSIAYTIRERVRIKGEIKTLTAQGRLSGLVIGLLPFALALMLYILSPSYMMLLFTTNIGLVMLGSSLFMEIVGLMIIRRIIEIKV